MSTLQVEQVVSAAHPSLAGHFPNEPIVPAVVLLDRVLEAVEQACGPCLLQEIPVVKFLLPLRPDERFVVELAPAWPAVRFRCVRNGLAIASGTLRVERC